METEIFRAGGQVTEANVVGALDGATLTGVTVATGDKVLVQDVDDSDNLKTVTAQSIADLASGGGKLLQVVSTEAAKFSTTTTVPYDDTIPQNTEGGEMLTLAITPESATSTLYFQFDGSCSSSRSSGETVLASLFVDSTADALVTGPARSVAAHILAPICFSHNVASGSTSARTYKVRMGGINAGTVYNYEASAGADDFGGVLNRGTLTIWEVEA